MPISHKFQIIFIHIPKCAGTSVWSALQMEPTPNNLISFEEPVLQHLLPAQLKGKYITETVWNSYRKITIVRNPYDRIISDFFWLRSKSRFLQVRSFDDFLNLAEKVVTEKRFSDNVYFDHFYPQHFYFEGIQYDDVLRVENLQSDFEKLRVKYGLPHRLPLINKGKPPVLRLTSRQQERVYDLYQRDFDQFGYDTKFSNNMPLINFWYHRSKQLTASLLRRLKG